MMSEGSPAPAHWISETMARGPAQWRAPETKDGSRAIQIPVPLYSHEQRAFLASAKKPENAPSSSSAMCTSYVHIVPDDRLSFSIL